MPIRKWTFYLLAFSLAFSSSAATAKPPLTVVCDPWPPYQTLVGRQVGGFSTKIVQTVFQRMRVAIGRIEAYPWRRAITMLETGEADALYSANYTTVRTRFARYPDAPLVVSPWVMWVRRASGLQFRSLQDLAGKRIGLVNGYSYTAALWDYVNEHSHVDRVPNDALNFKKLHAGRVDYIAAELRNGTYLVNQLGLDDLVPLTERPIKFVGLYIIFNRKAVSQPFVDRFSDELWALKKEPLFGELYETYFGDQPLDLPQSVVRPAPPASPEAGREP